MLKKMFFGNNNHSSSNVSFLFNSLSGLIVFLSMTLIYMSGSFAQTENQSMRNEIEILSRQLESTRAQMNDLEQIVYSGSKPPVQSSAQNKLEVDKFTNRLAIIETRVDEYDLRMRQASGRFDEVRFKIEGLISRIEKLVADVDFRLSALEQGAVNKAAPNNVKPDQAQAISLNNQAQDGASNTGTISIRPGQGYIPSEEPTVLGTLPVSNDGNTSDVNQTILNNDTNQTVVLLPDGSVEEQYAYAMSFMQESEWEKAGDALKEFTVQNRGHALAENAAYWRGESFYALKQYSEAARLYALNFQQFPNGNKAPDNLVKLGLSLVDLKRFPEACQTFDKLTSDFPQMRESINRAAQRGRSKAGC